MQKKEIEQQMKKKIKQKIEYYKKNGYMQNNGKQKGEKTH